MGFFGLTPKKEKQEDTKENIFTSNKTLRLRRSNIFYPTNGTSRHLKGLLANLELSHEIIEDILEIEDLAYEKGLPPTGELLYFLDCIKQQKLSSNEYTKRVYFHILRQGGIVKNCKKDDFVLLCEVYEDIQKLLLEGVEFEKVYFDKYTGLLLFGRYKDLKIQENFPTHDEYKTYIKVFNQCHKYTKIVNMSKKRDKFLSFAMDKKIIKRLLNIFETTNFQHSKPFVSKDYISYDTTNHLFWGLIFIVLLSPEKHDMVVEKFLNLKDGLPLFDKQKEYLDMFIKEAKVEKSITSLNTNEYPKKYIEAYEEEIVMVEEGVYRHLYLSQEEYKKSVYETWDRYVDFNAPKSTIVKKLLDFIDDDELFPMGIYLALKKGDFKLLNDALFQGLKTSSLVSQITSGGLDHGAWFGPVVANMTYNNFDYANKFFALENGLSTNASPLSKAEANLFICMLHEQFDIEKQLQIAKTLLTRKSYTKYDKATLLFMIQLCENNLKDASDTLQTICELSQKQNMYLAKKCERFFCIMAHGYYNLARVLRPESFSELKMPTHGSFYRDFAKWQAENDYPKAKQYLEYENGYEIVNKLINIPHQKLVFKHYKGKACEDTNAMLEIITKKVFGEN